VRRLAGVNCTPNGRNRRFPPSGHCLSSPPRRKKW
jgi:hypothetical protein